MAPPNSSQRMTADQVRRLLRAAERFDAEQVRARDRFEGVLVELRDEGVSLGAIALILGVSRQAVHQRLNRGQS